MLIKFSELPIPFGRLALGAVLINTEGNRYFKVVTEEYEYFWVNQLDVLLRSGRSDDLMSKTVDEALEELYPDYAKDYDSCQGVAEAMIYDWRDK